LNNQKKPLEKAVEHLYSRVLEVANAFLHNAKTYGIAFLQLENPTYEMVAMQMRQIASIISTLCDQLDDPLTGQKADEYCALMEEIARAISADDSVRLQAAVATLDRRPFL
jgi:arginine/lysine/ornithine decarboxylase